MYRRTRITLGVRVSVRSTRVRTHTPLGLYKKHERVVPCNILVLAILGTRLCERSEYISLVEMSCISRITSDYVRVSVRSTRVRMHTPLGLYKKTRT